MPALFQRMSSFQHSVRDWLWQTNSHEQSLPQRLLLNSCRLFAAVVRDLTQGYTNLHAMGLVYTTLLSVVPLLALSFSVLKGFGVHNQLEPVLLNLLAPIGGERSTEITTNVLNFVDNIQVGVLGALGLGFLVFTVISLVQKVERAFNEVWRISHVRSLAQRFSNYLSVIVIGPLLAFSALGATASFLTSDAVSGLIESGSLGWLFSAAGALTPYVVVIALFTFLYIFIPNTRVKPLSALIGGAVAGILWQSIGYIFTLVVAGSSRYTAIYSGFAAGILLLVWIYLTWLILLIGATVAYYSQHLHQTLLHRTFRPSAYADEAIGLTLLFRVARRFDQGLSGLPTLDLAGTLHTEPDITHRILNKLIEHRLILRTEDDTLVPAKPLHKVTLKEAMEVIRMDDDEAVGSLAEPIQHTLNSLEIALGSGFAEQSLETWVRQAQNGVP